MSNALGEENSTLKMNGFDAAAMEGLKSGELVVPNGDGTYRCLFCPSKTKLAFKTIFYHAKDVGVHKSGSATRGQHRALFQFLLARHHKERLDMTERAPPRERAALKRVRAEHQVVHPWVGLIYNSRTVDPDGRRVSPGPGELRQLFEEFHPEQVKEFWTFDGHMGMGMAAIIFKRDMEGYGNCRLFERSFLEARRGRQDWLENKETDRQGTDLYGWMAGEDDYDDKGAVGEFLRGQYNLKTMSQLGEEIQEKMRTSEQLQKELHETIQRQMQLLEKADTGKIKMMNKMEATEQATKNAELEMQLLEEKQRQEKEALRADSQRAKELLNQRARELEEKVASLNMRNAKMITKEKQNEAETERLKRERQENKMQQETVTKLLEARSMFLEEQLSLVKKRENEQKNLETLENEIQQRTLNLAQSTGKIAELEKNMKDLLEEKEGALDMVTDLTVCHRKAVDQLEDAKKAAVKVIQAVNEDVQAGIGVKRCGEIDDSCWEDVGEAHFNHPDWQAKLCKMSSEWDELIKKHDYWMPYKKVYLNEERTKFKEEVDPDDPLLKELRARFGDKAYNGVATALMEIQEYNASGRYAIPTCWNFAAKVSNPFTRGRAATLEEVVNHLGNMITTGKVENRRLQAEVTKLKGAGGGTGCGTGKRTKTTTPS